jgi:cell division protein FtsW (lipid II flippase)
MLIYLIPLLQFFVGLVHIIDAISSYAQKERPRAYYKNLERYALVVLGYFGILFVSAQLPTDCIPGVLLPITYLFIIPWIIAAYYWNIKGTDDHEEIEKLIF